MSFAAIAGVIGTTVGGLKIAGTAALGAAKASPGLLAAGAKATPGLLAKGAGQLNPMAGTAGSTMGPQQPSMMNKLLGGAKNLGTEELKKQLPNFGETLGTDKSKLGALTKDLINKAPEAARLGKAGQSKLGELVKELPQRGFDALQEQNKRNQELVSRYSTTPTLSPARPVYSTKLQSILEDYRRS